MLSIENKNTRYCILILGMHRSGTSATSGCCSLLGYKMGKRIVPPGEPNEKGYFENDSINRFNEELLDLLCARWHDTLHLPEYWWKDDRIKPMQTKLVKVLLDEFDSEGDFIIKDPRISVLLPFYLAIFKELSILPKVIINFRNPFEVAASLKKRDNLSLSKSLLLWVDTNLKAEFYSRSLPRLFLDYNSLLADPAATLKKIIKDLKLSKLTKEKKPELGLFIEPRLKHHAAKAIQKDEEIPKLVYQLYELLEELNLQDAEPKQQKLFDGINQQFLSEFHFFNGIDKTFNPRIKAIDEQNASKTYSASLSTGTNKIQFFPDQSIPIAEFWIYPVNQRAALQLKNLRVKTTNGETLPVERSETNAEKTLDDGIMIFESEFPYLRINLGQASILSEISFDLWFLAFSDFTYRFSVKKRNLYESDLLSNISQLQTEKNNLITSHNKTIAKLKNEVSDLHHKNISLIAVHDQTIAKLENEVRDLHRINDNLIIDHFTLITKLESKITQLQIAIDGLIVDHETELKNLESERSLIESEKNIQIKNLKSENTKHAKELKFSNDQLQLLMGSRSWKIGRSITWPIRKLKEKYRSNEE